MDLITRSKRCSIERETDKGTTGMVVTAHPLASKIGKQVLENGGNAIDAVVAIQFALNVVEPMNTGIGGSGFLMVHHAATKTTKIFDGHTQAPKGAYPEMFLDDEGEVIPFKERSTKGSAVGIPGILKAMDAALNEYGSKTLAELIEPAAVAAESGVEVNWVMNDTLDLFHYRLGDEAKKLFSPEGKGLKEGDKLFKEHLAKAFRVLQKEGIKAFYEGEIAEES